jgi:hypothetical protein
MLFAAAILLLNAGDCVSPLFADQQAKDCCSQGSCHRSQKSDPCCQTTPPSATQSFELSAKVTLDYDVLAVTDVILNIAPTRQAPVFSYRVASHLTFESPPGGAERVSLPLLL